MHACISLAVHISILAEWCAMPINSGVSLLFDISTCNILAERKLYTDFMQNLSLLYMRLQKVLISSNFNLP